MLEQNQNHTETWTKRADESSRAYALFCEYRDLGVNRSIAKAVEAFRQNGGKTSVRGAENWASQFSWVDRAEAYDLFMEASKRLEQEAKYLSDLATHQEKQKDSAKVLLGRAARVMKLLDERLDTLEASALTVQMIPVYLRAAASVAEAAIAIEAQALGVEEVIRFIKREESRQNKDADN